MLLRSKQRGRLEIASFRSWGLGVSCKGLDIASKGQYAKLYSAMFLIPLSSFLSSNLLAAITDMHRPTE
jgi:hypothetical protein